MEKICIKNQEDIQTTPIEVKASSLEVADEAQLFLTQADKDSESEKRTFQLK